MIQRIELVLLPEQAARSEEHKHFLAKASGIHSSEIREIKLVRRSIDARSRQVKYRLFYDVGIGENLPANQLNEREYKAVHSAKPVLITGAGPAGLFAALRLTELGFKPVLIERGKDVRNRRRDLAAMSKQGIVNPDSNYCFGEGGAGTYSDGKLYTRSDKRGNVQRMLETFVQFGADESITIDAHPHIGTNKLPAVVTAMRKQIQDAGGEVHFNTRLEDLILEGKKLKGILVRNSEGGQPYKIDGEALILATGHSARDVFEMLHRNKILIEAKDFALGVRIEHPQYLIDQIQYHCRDRSAHLPPAAYSLSGQYEDRGVYSFCMCPGGIIAPAATAPGEVVVNGWSPSKRNNPYSNSGMVVSVGAEDFKPYKSKGPMAAMSFQSAIERKCYDAGGGKLVAPAQSMTDFCEGKYSETLLSSSYLPGIKSVQLSEILPMPIVKALKKGLIDFGKKMKGYYTSEAVLVATESRTSSPVRIPRDRETYMHPEIDGLFPCAEGAGYAGGIISAAMDGEKCAEGVVDYLRKS